MKSKPKPKLEAVPLAGMTVKEGITISVEYAGDLAREKACPMEEVRQIEERSLLEWYQNMTLSLLAPIMGLNDLGKTDLERERRISTITNRLYPDPDAEPEATSVSDAFVVSLFRQAIISTMRPIKQRLNEIEAVCVEIAEDRGLNFEPSLPEPYSTLYARIVEDVEALN